ncbi:hypothetical protein MBLNU457_g0673t3 [Dothideomycetes sp. NU457]
MVDDFQTHTTIDQANAFEAYLETRCEGETRLRNQHSMRSMQISKELWKLLATSVPAMAGDAFDRIQSLLEKLLEHNDALEARVTSLELNLIHATRALCNQVALCNHRITGLEESAKRVGQLDDRLIPAQKGGRELVPQHVFGDYRKFQTQVHDLGEWMRNLQ